MRDLEQNPLKPQLGGAPAREGTSVSKSSHRRPPLCREAGSNVRPLLGSDPQNRRRCESPAPGAGDFLSERRAASVGASRPTLLLADAQPLVVEAFACLLEAEFEVVGRASDGLRLVEEALRLAPALVLTDLSLPRLGGLAAAGRLCRELPSTRVVFLTAHEDPGLAAEAFHVGASGYVLRSVSPAELTRALQAVLRGERWLSPGLADGNPDALPDPRHVPGRLGRLSPRRREVVDLLVEGHSMKQAAAALGISTRTIAYHKYQAMKALAVTSSAQLVRLAVESRLLARGGN